MPAAPQRDEWNGAAAIRPGAAPARRGAVEVRVRELSQLFDSMDPSPFHEKDLDADFEEYVVSSVRELHSDRATELVVYLDAPEALADEHDLLRRAIRDHFARRAELSRRALRQLLRRGWISLWIGLACLGGGLLAWGLVVQPMGEGPLASMLRESLLIGGWVAMWRPMEIFLYDWWPLRDERRVYEALSHTPVRVVCARAGEPPRTPREER